MYVYTVFATLLLSQRRPAFQCILCDSPLWSINAALWSVVLNQNLLGVQLKSCLILNIMNTKLIGYRTYRIWNLSNMELMGYRTYWIPTLKPRSYLILNYVRHRTLSDTYLFIFKWSIMVYRRQNHQSAGLLWLPDIWRREEEKRGESHIQHKMH